VNNIDGHAISMKQLNGKRKKTKMTQIWRMNKKQWNDI
jgi:hypothetical protein